jgi:hypothetical protein
MQEMQRDCFGKYVAWHENLTMNKSESKRLNEAIVVLLPILEVLPSNELQRALRTISELPPQDSTLRLALQDAILRLLPDEQVPTWARRRSLDGSMQLRTEELEDSVAELINTMEMKRPGSLDALVVAAGQTQ